MSSEVRRCCWLGFLPALDGGDHGGWGNPMACSIYIYNRVYKEKMRCRGGGSQPRRKEGRTWGRRRRAGEALPETLAMGVAFRAGGRGRERRIWPEGREERTLGSWGACCAASELAGSCRRGWWRRRRGLEREGEEASPFSSFGRVFFFTQICSDRGLNNPNDRVFCAKTNRFPRST